MSLREVVTVSVPRRPQILVTPAMLEAGRSAFKKERRNLSDLYDFFPCDLDDFLRRIYRAMQDLA